MDTSVIRDADLLAQLKGLEGTPGYRSLVSALIHTQQKRDKAAAEAAAKQAAIDALPRDQRRRAIIREVIENDPPSIQDVRHIHSVLAICGLPHSKPKDDVREYEKVQGNMSIDVSAGFVRDPNGNKVHTSLPYGPKARLILMHLCSEAIKQKSPTIEIADTLTGFVRDMGFPDNGGPRGYLTAFKQQLNALAGCTIKISAWNGERVKSKTIVPLEDVELWLSDNPDQKSLWPSSVTFSQAMFDSLQKHALPVNAQAVRAFAGSSRKLDLYFWIGWRLYNIKDPLQISWAALAKQFGQGFSRPRDFKTQMVAEMAHLQEVFPKLPIKLDEQGLRLHPADPDVLALPAVRPAKK